MTAPSIVASLIAFALAGNVDIALRAQAGAPVFLPAGSADAADARPLPGVTVLRWRLARIDFAVLAAARDGSGPEPAAQTLLLNLFPDVAFLARVDGREATFSGGYALQGRLDGVETGTATLVVNGAVAAGAVRTPAATYRIRSVGAPASSRWRTIMSYGSQCRDAGFDCAVIGAFSNPDLSYAGDPAGVPGDRLTNGDRGPADARRTLEATRRVVANFRRSKVVTPPDPPPRPCTYTLTPTRRYVLPRGGGPFEFTVTASASSCSWSPRTDADFLRLHTGTRTGSGLVRYSVRAHTGLGARTGVIRVGDDATFSVTTGPAHLLAPESGGVVSIAAAADADLTGLRRWDVAVDRMARSDTLRLQARHADHGAPGRTHETFVQHHHGVPVHGAGVNREIDRGLAVSIAGVVHESITVGTDPGLSAAEAAGRFEAATGSRLAPDRAPALTILPLADGSYALTWKMTHGDGETAFVDAHDGRIVASAP